MSRHVSDSENEVILIQIESLLKQLPTKRTPFPIRAMIRFHEAFFDKTRGDKYRFVQGLLGRGYRELTDRVSLLLNSSRLRVDKPDQFLTVAIHLTGGLGDVLIGSAYVRALAGQLSKSRFDIFAVNTDHAKFALAEADFVRNVLPLRFARELEGKYDLVVRVNEYVKYDVKDYSRIFALEPEFLNVISGAEERFAKYEIFYRRHPELNGLYARLSTEEGRNRLDVVGYLGNINVGRHTEYHLYPDISCLADVQKTMGGPQARYITIHDGFDATNRHVTGSATKCWPIEHWARFVRLFKQEFPEIGVVLLGSTKSRRIPGVDFDLVCHTSLHEAAWILKYSLLHVDGESGLVHVARALRTRSIVLFGPTSKDFFGYEGNVNLVSSACSNCWWSTADWLARCPRGFASPECMKSIMPEEVVAAAREALASNDSTASGIFSRRNDDIRLVVP